MRIKRAGQKVVTIGMPWMGIDRRRVVAGGLIFTILGTETANLIGYWPQSETPASQEYLTFNGTSTVVDCGSAASLDDLHDAILCVDLWIYSNASQTSYIISKTNASDAGWRLIIASEGIQFRVYDNTGATSTATQSGLTAGSWHHVTAYFNDGGDRKSYCAVDGSWASPGAALANPVGSDAAISLEIGARASGSYYAGKMAWIRISNNDRHTAGTPFTPPARTTMPTVDANTVGLWPMNEGYGSVAGDLSANGNDGTITDGDWGAYPAAVNAQGVAARNGAYTGVTLGQAVSPFTAPLFDGVNDFTNIYSASLAGAFDATAGTIAGFLKVSGAGIWTDGAAHVFAMLKADANNYILIQKTTTNGQLEFTYCADGTAETINKGSVSDTGWIHLAITWDTTADAVIAYYNGVAEGSPQTIAGTWAGALASATTVLGSSSTTVATPWNGYMAHVPLWTKALTAPQILAIYQASGLV